MKFAMTKVKSLIEEALEEPTTEDQWLDARYESDVAIIGHTNPYYILFFLLAEHYKPRFVVELGSWKATAAAHFAAGNPEGKVATIDIHKDDHLAKIATLETASRYDNLTYLNMWTWDAVSDISKLMDEAKVGGIDILFMDAWHEYDYVKREWELYEPLLASQALVICDDIMDAPGATIDMVKFWSELDFAKFLDSRPHPGIPMGFLHYKRATPSAKKATSKKK